MATSSTAADPHAAHPAHGAGPAHGGHPPHLAHQFDTPAQQFESVVQGMWLFLATEILLFGGLFCAYAVYRANHPEIFYYAHKYLDTFWGAVNTVILLCSSFTMAAGVWAAQRGRRGMLSVMLALTLLGGLGFLGIKYVEYKHKWEAGLLWGRHYQPRYPPGYHGDPAGQDAPAPRAPAAGAALSVATPPATTAPPATPLGAVPNAAARGNPPATADALAATDGPTVTATPAVPTADAPDPSWNLHAFESGPRGLLLPGQAPPLASEPLPVRNVHIFFGIYFAMTGLHGLHVVAGLIVIGWLLVGAVAGRYSGGYFTPVEVGGLYWHLVDLIWIYLFPLLYLIH